MDEPYTPINCGNYDHLEILAMRKNACVIEYRDDQGRSHAVRDVVLDVYSKDKQEFVTLAGGDTIRLDRLITVDGKPFSDTCES